MHESNCCQWNFVVFPFSYYRAKLFLSVDEIFVAFEYRERLKAYENEKKEYAKVLKAK